MEGPTGTSVFVGVRQETEEKHPLDVESRESSDLVW